MQRRQFIKRSVFGSALLGLGGLTGVALWPGDRSVRADRPLLCLTERTFPILVAVAARVLRTTTAQPAAVAYRVDEALRSARPEAARDINRALLLLENALTGFLLRGRARPFSELTVDEQDVALLAWRDSPLLVLNGAYHALRKLCLAAHYANEDAFSDARYPGPLIAKPAALVRDPRAPWLGSSKTSELP